MDQGRRRYPRVTCNVPAELEVCLDDGDESSAAVSFPVSIRSLTCDGLGIGVEPPSGETLAPGEEVTVRLNADGVPIALQGRIAWTVPFDRRRPVNAGIRIEVEPIDSTEGRAWADWVVDRITNGLDRSDVPPAVTAWLSELAAHAEAERHAR